MHCRIPMITFFSLSIALLIVGCSSLVSNDVGMPEDFNFSLSYGVDGKRKIDTFDGTIVKDLVSAGRIEADISFTEEEMEEIYTKMMDIDIMGDLDIPEEQNCGSIPGTISVWYIEMNGESQSIGYGSVCKNSSDDLKNLSDLEDYIHEMLFHKEEYQELPEPVGGYANS
ncbi:hypothetical protein [Litchfieldia alkalitelluris]|nr:hypothetical protein [Litchfieldia alkalitelluris]